MTGLILAAAVCLTAPAENFDAFFAEFARKRDAIRALEARFKQEIVTDEETVNAEGAIVYVRPRRIVFRYEQPDTLGPTYLIDDRKAYEYEPDVAQVQIYDLEDNPQTEVFFLGFDDNTETLREAYDVEVFDADEPGPGKRGIRIRPKKGEDEPANFREVRLYLRDTDCLPYRIRIENDDGSRVAIDVSDFDINKPLDPARTQIALSPNTKIFENDELTEKVGQGGKSIPEPLTPDRPAAEGTAAP